mmetsp:Transcript_27462/g.64701  ORF Transcript_27462/g.64701 Transcript_27462/m.64701 type:complete len:138 (+) Transcript_27462:189-602(+)
MATHAINTAVAPAVHAAVFREADAVAQLQQQLSALEVQVASIAKADGPFFAGARDVGFVDFVLGPFLARLPVVDPAFALDGAGASTYPRLAALLTAVMETPAWHGTMPTLQELAATYQQFEGADKADARLVWWRAGP